MKKLFVKIVRLFTTKKYHEGEKALLNGYAVMIKSVVRKNLYTVKAYNNGKQSRLIVVYGYQLKKIKDKKV